MRLQFPLEEIRALGERYSYEDDARVRALGRTARGRGWFTGDEFLEIAEWKTRRIRSRVAENSSRSIEALTRAALAVDDPLVAAKALRALSGVDWSVASVFLHLGHRLPFPILDWRALEALGVRRQTAVSGELWLEYVNTTRTLADEADVDMRTLDRALWQWSKEQGQQRARVQGNPRPTRGPAERPAPGPIDAVILGCVSGKRRGRWPAKDLYDSPLWRKRRAYAEASGHPWFIYSAKYGMLEPDTLADWYDVALMKLPRSEQRAKGVEAVDHLERIFGPLDGKTFEIHAGSVYANTIEGPLAARGAALVNPLAGRSIGQHLHWYGRGGAP